MNPLFAAALDLQQFFEARDIALGAMPFEERCVERSSAFVIGDKQSLNTCCAEDLVVFKAFAGRDRDWLDIEGIVLRQVGALDTDTIWRELMPLLELKGDAESTPRLRRLLTKDSPDLRR